MDNFTIFTWLLTATTIFGTYLNSRQNKYGFLVWGLCNMLWLGVDFNRGIYAQAALYVVFIGFNVYGWRQWGKKDKEVVHNAIWAPTFTLKTLKSKIHNNISLMNNEYDDEDYYIRDLSKCDLMLIHRLLVEKLKGE